MWKCLNCLKERAVDRNGPRQGRQPLGGTKICDALGEFLKKKTNAACKSHFKKKFLGLAIEKLNVK